MTIRKARNKAGDRASRRRSEARPGSAIDGPPALRRCLGAAAAAGPAKHRPEGFARKVPSCGVARLVEQNERSTFVARLASEHFSCKRGSQRVLYQPASADVQHRAISRRGRNRERRAAMIEWRRICNRKQASRNED